MFKEICHSVGSIIDTLQNISDVSIMKVESHQTETKIFLASTKNIYSHVEFKNFTKKISKECPGLLSSYLPYITEHHNVMFGFLKIKGNITIVVYPDVEIYSWAINSDCVDVTAVPLSKLTGKQGCLADLFDLFSNVWKKLRMLLFKTN